MRPTLSASAAGHVRRWIALMAPLAFAFAAHGAPAAAQGDLVAYAMVDQWPERQQAAEGLFERPVDLDLAADGRVFIADRDVGGIHVLEPSGAFSAPLGVTGGYPSQLGRVGQAALGPDPAGDGERLYVLDSGTQRVVVYGEDGTYLAQWEDIDGYSIAASSDGRVYVLDRVSTRVVAYDAETGAERFSFGGRGTDDGSFSNLSDVSVAPDGRVLAVTDKNGQRVQLFDLATDADLAAAEPPAPARLRETYDLLAARYNKGDATCRGSRVSALGDDRVFVGEGATACLIEGTSVTFAIAASAANGTVCRDSVRLPALRADTLQYFALATYDPNSGACGNKRTDLDTSPVIVRYDDEELRSVRTVWHAADNEGRSSSVMFGPQRLSMPADDVVFVQDSSALLRFYSLAGEPLATAARDSSVRDAGTDTAFFRLTAAEGAETLGEVYGGYVYVKRSGGGGELPPGPRPRDEVAVPDQGTTQPSVEFEMGIGRFRTVERPVDGSSALVLEPIWKVPLSSGSGRRGRQQIQIPVVAYNRVSRELLVVRTETVAQQRTMNVVIARYQPDGTPIDTSWDVPDDGQVNPYADIAIGPDGRVYLLDDLEDVVRVLEPDGAPAYEVPVAMDARAVAGGPPGGGGSVFVLREVGAIERYDEQGAVTARLDGRALPYSDPTTLTDLVVDGSGRVYVADGQSSLVSVFAPSEDPDALPVPDDGTCAFVGKKAASPDRVALGDPVAIELELRGLCAVQEEPTDIVVVAPYFRQLEQGVDPSAGSMANLLRLVSRVDFDKHRVGLVTYYTGATVDLALAHDAAAYRDAVRAVQRFTPPNQDVKARLKSAIEAAAELYDDPTRRRVMVLVEAQYCDPANERFPGQCAGYPPAEDAAQAVRDAGITIVVVQSFGASNLASSDRDFVPDLAGAHRRMVDYRLPEALAESVSVVDEVPGNMRLDASSVSAPGSWTAPHVSWPSGAVERGGARYAFSVEPLEAGRWPTNVSAVAEIVDGWGGTQQVVFPVPIVEVIGPTPTPGARVTPATPTPTRTPRAETHAAYLPLLSNRACGPAKDRFDLALLVDVSNSMSGAKLEAARSSVRAFLDAVSLGPDDDHVALVSFAYEAGLEQGLTSDRARLEAALAGLAPRAGTRVDRALDLGLAELAGPRSRPMAGRAIVLLSDGGQTEAIEAARSAARTAASRGIQVFAVGLGQDADGPWLAEIAGDPSRYFAAPDAAGLGDVYRTIAASLSRCP